MKRLLNITIMLFLLSIIISPIELKYSPVTLASDQLQTEAPTTESAAVPLQTRQTQTPFRPETATALPTATPVATQTVTPTPYATPTPVFDGWYTVQAGDTVSAIAKHYHVSVSDLAAANGIVDPNWLTVGQYLVVPGFGVKTLDHGILAHGIEIFVVLSEQRVYFYQDGVLLKSFTVSTGVRAHPTVIGRFRIYVKLRYTRMTGQGYDLADVPFTMYFYQGYGLHGTYWHHNFGTPMSHGCINLRTSDAEWIYNRVSVGTDVLVIP